MVIASVYFIVNTYVILGRVPINMVMAISMHLCNSWCFIS